MKNSNNKKNISSAKTKINHMNRSDDDEYDEWDSLYDDTHKERREDKNRRAERKQLKYSSDNS